MIAQTVRHKEGGMRATGHETRILAHMARVQRALAELAAAKKCPRMERRRLSAEVIAEMRRLRRTGHSYDQIARAVGLSYKSAWNHCRDVKIAAKVLRLPQERRSGKGEPNHAPDGDRGRARP